MYTVQLLEIYRRNGKLCKRFFLLYTGNDEKLAALVEFENTLAFHTVKKEIDSSGSNIIVTIKDNQA